MTKKTRTILFVILFFCFALATPAVLFYSWGYRFDFQTKRIVKIGAFYFKVLPKSVYISVIPAGNKKPGENEVIKKTDLFFGSALIENLLPKTYEVEIQKEGFYSWKKNLEIKENQVTEQKNVVLVPKDAGISSLNKNTTDFFPSPDEKFAILKEKSTSSVFALKIFDLEKNVKSHLIDGKDISKNAGLLLLDLKFSPDAKKILLKVDDKGSIKYFLVTLNQVPQKPKLLDFLGKDAEQIYFNHQNLQEMFVLEKGNVFVGDFTQNKIASSSVENVKTLQISGNDFYYLDASGFLFRTDFSFSNPQKINNLAFFLQKEKKYKILLLADRIFLEDGQKLFLFNPDSGTFEDFFEMKNEIKISPDSKKAVYWSDSEIWLVFLKQDMGQPKRETGQRVFIARFSEKIGDVFWLTPHYLIFSAGSKIKVAETDDRDVVNVIDLTEFNSPKIFWNQTLKKLFILSQDNFYGSKQLLP